jgi:hypothetical protein
MLNKRYCILSLSLFLLAACTRDKSEPESGGLLVLNIEHSVQQNPLVVDDFLYTNEAGNNYMVTEIQWFFSDMELFDASGNTFTFPEAEQVFYVDTDIEATKEIKFKTRIPAGNYSGIRFIFGLNEQKNKSNRFVNPPESFMFWPEYLGGGYHYMKLNGKWINPDGLTEPFNFHLGIGQVYETNNQNYASYTFGEANCYEHCEGYRPGSILPSVKAFIHNYFQVNIDDISFSVADGKQTNLTLEMKVENWFRNPHTYNHNQWGGSIMQQQDAMKMGCENGHDVFQVKPSE